MTIDAIVVVPARDERQRIPSCLQALAAQTINSETFEVLIVLDDCRDDTREQALQWAARLGLNLDCIDGPGQGPGPARRLGMDHACQRLLDAGRPDGLIATTDADTRPAADWLQRQREYLAAGAHVIAGRIELDRHEAASLPAGVLAQRAHDAQARLHQVRVTDPHAPHHHFAGASLGLSAALYRAVGGLEPLRDLEDDAFARRLTLHQVPITRAADVVVVTSARTDGRAARGLSTDLAVSDWMEQRRFDATQYAVRELASVRERLGVTITVIIPTKKCADTIRGVLEQTVGPARTAGLIDDVLVVDAGSEDDTAQIATQVPGTRVVQQDTICPQLGPAGGKGDAMWRALQVSGGEIVAFLDGDTGNPHPDHLIGLLGPLLHHEEIAMVRGSFERPFRDAGGETANEGGRVTELMARPLLNLYEPLLAGFSQPLAGEFAARRDLLEQLSFPVGYGVEIATLIDTLHARGLDAIAESQLGVRHNRHQPLRTLGEMAYAILAAVDRRRSAATPALASGSYVRPWAHATDRTARIPVDERPPIATHAGDHHLGAPTPISR